MRGRPAGELTATYSLCGVTVEVACFTLGQQERLDRLWRQLFAVDSSQGGTTGAIHLRVGPTDSLLHQIPSDNLLFQSPNLSVHRTAAGYCLQSARE